MIEEVLFWVIDSSIKFSPDLGERSQTCPESISCTLILAAVAARFPLNRPDNIVGSVRQVLNCELLFSVRIRA